MNVAYCLGLVGFCWPPDWPLSCCHRRWAASPQPAPPSTGRAVMSSALLWGIGLSVPLLGYGTWRSDLPVPLIIALLGILLVVALRATSPTRRE